MKNNLFSFATSELSQDAFICWCLNWFNDKTNQKLHEMAISLIKRMTGDIEIESVEIIRQYSDVAEYIDENGNKKKQAVKIDVLAIINKSIGLIIEDKTFSSVHDDQIMRYDDGLKIILSKSDNNQLFYKGKTYLLDPELIKTVFWKTGFNYDYDQAIKADVKFDGETIKGFLSGYRGINEILDDYLDNLENNLRWYKENGDFTIPFETDSGEKRYDWYCNLSQNQYPQYCLMRTFFHLIDGNSYTTASMNCIKYIMQLLVVDARGPKLSYMKTNIRVRKMLIGYSGESIQTQKGHIYLYDCMKIKRHIYANDTKSYMKD